MAAFRAPFYFISSGLIPDRYPYCTHLYYLRCEDVQKTSRGREPSKEACLGRLCRRVIGTAVINTHKQCVKPKPICFMKMLPTRASNDGVMFLFCTNRPTLLTGPCPATGHWQVNRQLQKLPVKMLPGRWNWHPNGEPLSLLGDLAIPWGPICNIW